MLVLSPKIFNVSIGSQREREEAIHTFWVFNYKQIARTAAAATTNITASYI